MAQTKKATETQNPKQTGLHETRETQTPASRQAGYNQPRETTGSDRGLTRYDQTASLSPFGFMRRFSEEMDRLFEDFGSFGSSLGSSLIPSGFGESTSLWSPQTEVFERDGDLVIQTDLPGMNKEDIDVSIEDDQIIIRGERRSENEQNQEGVYHTERSYGSFYRSFPLPQNIDTDKAKASFRNGVLEVTMPLPRQEEANRGRKIEISEEK